jgi:hypothetical protein
MILETATTIKILNHALNQEHISDFTHARHKYFKVASVNKLINSLIQFVFIYVQT